MTKLFSTKDAAKYLNLSVPAVKYHIHQTSNLKGQLVGKTLVFTRADLDEFAKNRRPQGRPKKVTGDAK